VLRHVGGWHRRVIRFVSLGEPGCRALPACQVFAEDRWCRPTPPADVPAAVAAHCDLMERFATGDRMGWPASCRRPRQLTSRHSRSSPEVALASFASFSEVKRNPLTESTCRSGWYHPAMRPVLTWDSNCLGSPLDGRSAMGWRRCRIAATIRRLTRGLDASGVAGRRRFLIPSG
jgi:hypothetical protein